jgi:hypothetical protein
VGPTDGLEEVGGGGGGRDIPRKSLNSRYFDLNLNSGPPEDGTVRQSEVIMYLLPMFSRAV